MPNLQQLPLPFQEEIWKDIEDFEGLYLISNLGHVQGLDRTVPGFRGGKKTLINVKGKLLLPASLPSGYLFVSLCKNGKYRQLYVHRLVGTMFLPNPLNKRYINHKNGNKKDNRAANLEWCTQSENNIHAFANGLMPHQKGEQQSRAKLTETQALKITNLCANHTTQEIMEIMGFEKKDRHLVANIKCGRIWKHLKVG